MDYRSKMVRRMAGWLAVSGFFWPALVLSEPRPAERGEPSLRLQVKEVGKFLEIKYALQNTDQAILVYDRQVRESKKGTVRDPEQIQRFVNGTTLRLFLGEAPEPDRDESFGFVPHISKLAPHATLSRTFRVSAPPTEYSAMLPDDPKFVEAPIKQVVMFLEYEGSKGVSLKRSSVFPDAFQLGPIPSTKPVKRVQSNSVPLETSALRVSAADFPRLWVEGDK